MKETVFCLALMCISASIVHADVSSICGDDSWIAFKDENCVRLFQTFQTRDAAEEICRQQGSTLASIKSAAEQTFLSEYVSNISEHNNVWIGAKRRQDSYSEFDWNDGSPVQRYSNWGVARPSNDTRRTCVLMQSKLSRQLSDMPWADYGCGGGNWFICQKLQTWSSEHFQQAILGTRRDLQHFVDNSIPIGFIYIQLQNQEEPSSLWTTVEWTEVTTQYAGLFFRAVGQGSAAFGTVQAENSPRLTRVSGARNLNPAVTVVDVTANGGVSGTVSSGTSSATNVKHWGLAFTVSTGEVRPRNTAMRIWQRTG